MATVTFAGRTGGVVNSAAGSFTSDGAAQTLTLGFKPCYVKVINETDAIVWEVTCANSATKVVKYNGTGPAITIDTGSAIVINSDGTVTLSSTAVGTSKVIAFWASA